MDLVATCLVRKGMGRSGKIWLIRNSPELHSVTNSLDVLPVHLEDAVVRVGELVEERGRHIEVSVVATGTFVHNGSSCLLAVG